MDIETTSIRPVGCWRVAPVEDVWLAEPDAADNLDVLASEARMRLGRLAILCGIAGLVAAVAKACALVKACRHEADAVDRTAAMKARLQDELRYMRELVVRLQRESAADAVADGLVELDRTMGWLDSVVTPLERRLAELREKISGTNK